MMTFQKQATSPVYSDQPILHIQVCIRRRARFQRRIIHCKHCSQKTVDIGVQQRLLVEIAEVDFYGRLPCNSLR